MDTNLQTYTVLVEIVHMTINRVAPSSTVWPCVPVLWSPDIPAVLDRIRWPEERQRSNIHSYFFYLIQYHKGSFRYSSSSSQVHGRLQQGIEPSLACWVALRTHCWPSATIYCISDERCLWQSSIRKSCWRYSPCFPIVTWSQSEGRVDGSMSSAKTNCCWRTLQGEN